MTGPATPRQNRNETLQRNWKPFHAHQNLRFQSFVISFQHNLSLAPLSVSSSLFFFSVQFFCHAHKAPSKDQQIIHFKKCFWKTLNIFVVGLFVYSFSWAVTSIEAFDCNWRRVHWKWVRNKPQRLLTSDRRHHQGIVGLFVQMSWPSPDTSSI